jgi:hypothetical protein
MLFAEAGLELISFHQRLPYSWDYRPESLCLAYLLRWCFTASLSGMALNCNHPNLCLQSSWDHRLAQLHPSLLDLFWPWFLSLSLSDSSLCPLSADEILGPDFLLPVSDIYTTDLNPCKSLVGQACTSCLCQARWHLLGIPRCRQSPDLLTLGRVAGLGMA